MTDLPARLRESAERIGLVREGQIVALLREAAAEIERLTVVLDSSAEALNGMAQTAGKAQTALRAAEQRADAAEAERDHWVGAYNSELDRSIAAEARCAALTEALREDESFWQAFPRWRGQDQAMDRMMEMLEAARALLAPSGGEPTPEPRCNVYGERVESAGFCGMPKGHEGQHVPTSPPAEPCNEHVEGCIAVGVHRTHIFAGRPAPPVEGA